MAVSVQHLLTQYGYWAIFFAIFFEDFGIPVPGETLLITASGATSSSPRPGLN
jgi:membrane protein DedA with SNARE-associated domain